MARRKHAKRKAKGQSKRGGTRVPRGKPKTTKRKVSAKSAKRKQYARRSKNAKRNVRRRTTRKPRAGARRKSGTRQRKISKTRKRIARTGKQNLQKNRKRRTPHRRITKSLRRELGIPPQAEILTYDKDGYPESWTLAEDLIDFKDERFDRYGQDLQKIAKAVGTESNNDAVSGETLEAEEEGDDEDNQETQGIEENSIRSRGTIAASLRILRRRFKKRSADTGHLYNFARKDSRSFRRIRVYTLLVSIENKYMLHETIFDKPKRSKNAATWHNWLSEHADKIYRSSIVGYLNGRTSDQWSVLRYLGWSAAK